MQTAAKWLATQTEFWTDTLQALADFVENDPDAFTHVVENDPEPS